MEKTTKGTLYVLIAMVLFSTGGLFIKLINANAYTIVFGRACIAGLIFLPLIQWKKLRLSKTIMRDDSDAVFTLTQPAIVKIVNEMLFNMRFKQLSLF